MPTDPTARVLLYVEDDVLIQFTLVGALEDAGFRVILASHGGEALELLANEAQSLDGLITDVNLGDGPDGWQVARHSRERMSGLPVIYVSAASEHEWTSRGVPDSVMITKPFVTAHVVGAISSLLAAAY